MSSISSEFKTLGWPLALVMVATAMSRLVGFWPNFTPVLAIALIGGYAFRSSTIGTIVTLAAMVLSDIALGFQHGTGYALHTSQLWVYGSLVGIVLLGRLFRKHSAFTTTMVGGTLAGVGFFLVSNFAVWLHGTMYPQTLDGLMACYGAGLAFYRDGGNFMINGVVSTWLFSALLFVCRGVMARTSRTSYAARI